MDVMIFCQDCNIEEMIDFGDAEDWKCPKCHQAEHRKPEDPDLLLANFEKTDKQIDALK